MIEIIIGCSRIAILIGKYAIKIPNFTLDHHHFSRGLSDNWREREFYKYFSKRKDGLSELASPSIFCSWFGLIQIQLRCTPLEEDLTDEEKEIYYPLCGNDCKKENFGWYKGRKVCLDYSNLK